MLTKRTFEALQYPKGSIARQNLNQRAETSEYMTSYKWVAQKGIHNRDFRTKTEAEAWLLN